MQHPNSKIAVAMWAAGEDDSGPPSVILRLEAQNPGAAVLLGNLQSLNSNSSPNEIQRAFAQGLGQCDVASVLPEPVPPSSAPPKASKAK